MPRQSITLTSRLLPPALIALLVLAFVTGGGSYDRGWGDAVTQLLAWPVLGLGLTRHFAVAQPPRSVRWLLLGVACVPAGLALQWAMGWTQTPWATERGLLAVMPAVAMFVGTLALSPRHHARLMWAVSGLVGFSVALAFLQLGAPQDSLLNPFPEWAPALGGVFANPNHHATVLTMAVLWLGAWAWNRWRMPVHGQVESRGLVQGVAVATAALVLLAVLPLTGSRAMVLIAIGALIVLPFLQGGLIRDLRHHGRRRRSLVIALALLAFGALLVVVISGWIKTDSQFEFRGALMAATAGMATEAMPWGRGVGSFVPWFDAHATGRLVQYEYFNHAHNEYAQWWLESGVLGWLWMAALLGWAAWACPWPGRANGPQPPQAVAAWLAVMVVLAHSVVDYPLRTQSVMVLTAALAGVASHYAVNRLDTKRAEKNAAIHNATHLA